MSATTRLPAPISLARPWPLRLLDALRERLSPPPTPHAWTDADLRALEGLSPETLRDIGVPDWVAQEAQWRDERRRDALVYFSRGLVL